jgi:hypothetical protein
MTEEDSFRDVLREWHAAEPSHELDQRVLAAYRKAEISLWNRIWYTRISVPVPVLILAALLLLAVVFWFRPSRGSRSLHQLDAAGFQPLPHGDARVISVKELYK